MVGFVWYRMPLILLFFDVPLHYFEWRLSQRHGVAVITLFRNFFNRSGKLFGLVELGNSEFDFLNLTKVVRIDIALLFWYFFRLFRANVVARDNLVELLSVLRQLWCYGLVCDKMNLIGLQFQCWSFGIPLVKLPGKRISKLGLRGALWQVVGLVS